MKKVKEDIFKGETLFGKVILLPVVLASIVLFLISYILKCTGHATTYGLYAGVTTLLAGIAIAIKSVVKNRKRKG